MILQSVGCQGNTDQTTSYSGTVWSVLIMNSSVYAGPSSIHLIPSTSTMSHLLHSESRSPNRRNPWGNPSKTLTFVGTLRPLVSIMTMVYHHDSSRPTRTYAALRRNEGLRLAECRVPQSQILWVVSVPSEQQWHCPD